MLQLPAIYYGCKPKQGSRTYSTDSAAFADQNDFFAESGRRGRGGDLHALALDQCLDIPVVELLLAALGTEELHQHIRQGGFCAVEVDLIVEVGVLDGNTTRSVQDMPARCTSCRGPSWSISPCGWTFPSCGRLDTWRSVECSETPTTFSVAS